ncbi:MAG: DUF2752 domain-containing protein [Arcicella sp.]|jgi:hypothetical protein|nr:DUF2752 domain-containing protein [Arcicella sp.]
MLRKINIELLFWISGLIWLAVMNPSESHFTLCPIKNLGLSFCPGCGLGHSISYLFHGEIQESLHHHPLGIFALIVIFYRIFQLTRTTGFSLFK